MSGRTSIEWTDCTWNPARGCSRVSEGCRNCYAERIAARFAGGYRGDNTSGYLDKGEFFGFASMTQDGPRWTGRIELVESKLDEPLRWRKPRRVFVNSMSDLFHEALPDDAITRIFAVMAMAPQHTFQVLTKRPRRMRAYLSDAVKYGDDTFSREEAIRIRMTSSYAPPGKFCARIPWPLPNVWLGVSVEDQATADERIPLLLDTPAALRFVSYEPALGPVDFTQLDVLGTYRRPHHPNEPAVLWNALTGFVAGPGEMRDRLDWVIVGGESGPGARPFEIAWARSTIAQCVTADVACFVKQLGTNCWIDRIHNEHGVFVGGVKWSLAGGKGGDVERWPADLRIREFPKQRAVASA